MSLDTPTTKEISDSIIAQLEAALSQTIPQLPKAFNTVLARVLGAVFILLYKYGGFIFQQLFVQTATIEEVTILGKTFSPLIAWGELIGAGRPVAATQAELDVEITVTLETGQLDSGTPLLNADNGVTYLLVGSVLLNAPTVSGLIRAAGDQSNNNGAGAIGNLVVGDIASFANPLANVDRDTVVTAQIVTAANAESTEAYRQRVIDRFQKRPQGGALIDYEIWGEEVAGIINVYAYTGNNPGEVDLYSEATVASSGNADGIPTATQLQAVFDAVQLDENGLASRRPANAAVNSFPITRVGFNVEVVGLTVDNPSQVQSDITAEIVGYMLDRAPFVSGATIGPRTDSITKTSLVGLVDGIVVAADGTFSAVNFSLTSGGGNLQFYILAQGEKAKATTVAYN